MVRDPRGSRPAEDLAFAVFTAAVLVAVGIGAVIYAGAAVAAVVTGHAVPTLAIESVLAALRAPGDPSGAWDTTMPSAGLVWTFTIVVLAVAIAAVTVVWRGWRQTVGNSDSERTLSRLPGTASAREIRKVAGARSLMKRAARLRPSVHNPKPADVGYLLGTARGVKVHMTVEDSVIILGPTRSGKGLHLIIPAILNAPGAVVTTSTRPDNLTVTLAARRRAGGPVAVFDPQGLAPGVPAGLRWSPVRGCEDPQTAMTRARGLAAGTGLGGGGVENGDFWKGQTESVLRGMLHAAALDGRTASDLYRWSLDPVAALEAHRILSSSPSSAVGWAEAVESAAKSDARTRDSIWLGVRQALAALADPRVLEAVTPRASDVFDPETFIRDRGTLYLLGTATGAAGAAALVSALIEDMVEAGRKMAAASPSSRLDPPLSLVLDEIGNLVPLASLPTLISEGGGTGITTIAVLQSLAQARDKWGQETANSIWDASTVKIILGGAANARDLQDVVAIVGERDDETVTTSRGRSGDYTRQVSYRRIAIMDTGRLRTLPFGTGLLMLRSAPPIVLSMRSWQDRKDAKQLKVDQQQIESGIGSAFQAQYNPTARAHRVAFTTDSG